MLCEPAESMGDDMLRALAWTLTDRGMEVWWGPDTLRLRFSAAPRECMVALGTLAHDLAWLGLDIRLYQLNGARSIAATERLGW